MGSQLISSMGLCWSFTASFVFYLLTTRLLSTEHAAEVMTVVTFATIVGILQSAVSSYVLMRSKEREGSIDGVRSGLRSGMLFASAAALLTIALSPLLQSFLHFGSIFPFLILAFGYFIAAGNGVLQGALAVQKRMASLIISNAGDMTIRIVMALLLFRLPYDPSFTSGIVLAGGCASLLLALLFLRKDLSHLIPPSQDTSHPVSYLITNMFSLLLLNLIFQLMVLWPKHALAPATAAIMILLMKLATLFSTGTGAIVQATTIFLNRSHVRWFLTIATGEILLALCLTLGMFFLEGDTIIRFVFGAQYAGHIPLLLLLLISSAAYAVVSLGTSFLFLLHREKMALAFLLPLAVTLVGGEWLVGSTPLSIGFVLLAILGFFASCLLGYLYLLATRLHETTTAFPQGIEDDLMTMQKALLQRDTYSP